MDICVYLIFFYCLGKYKISISYKSKVLLHFHIKKYKINDSNFIIFLLKLEFERMLIILYMGKSIVFTYGAVKRICGEPKLLKK